MGTQQFQESTIAIIKAIASTQVEYIFQQFREAKKGSDSDPANASDNSTNVALTEYVTASIIAGIIDNKSSEELVEYLAAKFVGNGTPPLSNKEAIGVADTLLRPTITGLLKVVTNPEDTSLDNDKDIIRDAVLGWGRSVKGFFNAPESSTTGQLQFIPVFQLLSGPIPSGR